MRIATWNVNSIRTRVDVVLDFLRREQIDVLAMQEIKCKSEVFPRERFAAAGYETVAHGFGQWNGVAFASLHPLTEVATAFPGQPGFGSAVKGQEGVQLPGPNGLPQEARALGVTVAGMRLWSLYVPNGRALGDPHYEYKLAWLRQLRQQAQEWLAAEPELPLALLGDWNIAPLAQDVGDPDLVEGISTHVSAQEREMFAAFGSDFTDVVRPYEPSGYTFWEYRGGKFRLNQGVRIDFILGSQAFNSAVTGGYIAADERREKLVNSAGEFLKPSDHVPVVCEIDPELLGAAWETTEEAMIWQL